MRTAIAGAMRIVALVWWTAVTLPALIGEVSTSRVALVNNGYSGLVVGVDERVDVLKCHDVLDSLQTLLNKASAYLYTSTNRRAFFSDVTVVVPSSWPRSCTGGGPPGQATTESYLTSDVRLSTAHPVYGSAPWTRQWGLCGQPGAFIQIDAEYVAAGDNETYGSQARALVREWAKYRWGVFEEVGYPEDPLYPSFYRTTTDQWRPTGCSDGTVIGDIYPPGCEASSNTCTFVPFLNDSNSGITSSIMYLPSLGQVKNFCDDGNHDKAAPTKHNMICHEASTWEIIKNHRDFRNGSNPPRNGSTVPAVDFRIVKATTDRFFFLLESTATMRQQERWDFVSSSIRKFVNWDVPTSVQVGIGHFGSVYRTDRNLTTVPGSLMGRGELANLPPIADDVMEDSKNWTLAIDGALAALGHMAAGTTLIWVTGNQEGSMHAPSTADVEHMISLLKQKQARLVVVFYPSATPGLSRIAMETGGDVIAVPDMRLGDQTSISVFHSLSKAYDFTLDKHISNKRLLRVQVEDRQFVGNGQQARGSFLVDTTLGVNTTLTVLYNDRSEIGYVKLRPPGGLMREVYTYPDSTNHLQYARVDQTQGQWEYEIDNLAPSHSSIFVQVTSSSGSSEDTVRAQVWTDVNRTRSLNATERPLVIYASVLRGHAPVLDTQVYAVVTRASGRDVRIQLLDNGLGVPDILHGDGIYSRYFTDFGPLSSANQLFNIRVEVGGGSHARVVTGRDLAQPRAVPVSGGVPCCGSTIGSVTSVPVHDLKRSASGGGILVTGGADQQVDIYPPGRVTDLKSEVDPTQQTVTFSWSAPGDDFDKPDTRVSHYEVRFCESRSRLRQHFSDCTSVTHWSQPEPAGTPSLAVIDFDIADTLLFFAIRGVDEAGNVAPLSNIVSLVMPPPQTPSPPPPTGTTAPVQPTPPSGDSSLLLIILLCVAGLIMLVVMLALYFFLCYRRRKPAPDVGPQRRITTVTVPPVQSREPTPVKVAYEMDHEEAVPTISNGRTPSMWTASDILDTQKRRHSPVGGGGGGGDRRDLQLPNLDRDNSQYGSTQPLNAAQLAVGRARYNSYQTPYVEDMPYDGNSLVSTQPSDSFVSLTSDPRQRSNGALCQPEPTGWHSDKDSLVQTQRASHARVPPPTLPKPRINELDGAEQRGSRASVAADRRRRNVTQV